MRLLLDASALLGSLSDRPSWAASKAAIADRSYQVWVSAVTPYELEWKKHIGKIDFPDVADWEAQLSAHGFSVAPLTARHAVAAARLPVHNRDPWDRMIVAQALADGLTVVAKDRALPLYGVPVLW